MKPALSPARYAWTAALAIGCGGSEAAPTVPNAPEDASGVDAGSTKPGPIDAAKDAEENRSTGYTLDTTRRVGIVWGGVGQGGNLGFAGFGASAGVWGVDLVPSACREGTMRKVRSGACVKVSCEADSDSTSQNAGRIELSSGGAKPDLSLLPPEYRSDSITEKKEPTWTAGTTITVTGSGSSSVPAFTTTLVQPPGVSWRVTSGTFASGVVTQSRLKDLVVEWDGSVTFDDFRIALMNRRRKSADSILVDTIECLYPPRDGKGVIPAAMMNDLIVGSAVLDIFGENRKIVEVPGEDPILVSAWLFNQIPFIKLSD